MELQDYIKLHKMKAEAARNFEERSSFKPVRTSVSYTKEEHEELASMLKELQAYREKESSQEKKAMEALDYIKNGPNHEIAYLSNAMQEDYLRRNWQRASISEKIVFQNIEVVEAAMKLQSCFRGSRFLTDRNPIEFLADEKSNTYFILGTCETKLDVDCKVLEWVSRAACKTTPYQREVSNENFHRQMLASINAYLGTSFSREDIELIYTRLGNACNHEKTVEFVKSGFDFSILNPDMAKQEQREYVKTNVGFIPLEDYYDIRARKNGFEDYEDMRDNGYSIDKPETTTLLSEELDMDGYLNI